MAQEKNSHSTIHQTVQPSDCCVVALLNDTCRQKLEEMIGDSESAENIRVLYLSNGEVYPWKNRNFLTFVDRNSFRQIVVAGDILQANVVGVCLFALEEGFQVFCVDTKISDATPERAVNLLRLVQAGATPLTAAQFFAELSF